MKITNAINELPQVQSKLHFEWDLTNLVFEDERALIKEEYPGVYSTSPFMDVELNIDHRNKKIFTTFKSASENGVPHDVHNGLVSRHTIYTEKSVVKATELKKWVEESILPTIDRLELTYEEYYNGSNIRGCYKNQETQIELIVLFGRELAPSLEIPESDMYIMDVGSCDYENEEETVEVTACNALGIAKTFYVQTTDGLYRQDLGCWIFVDEDHANIDFSDYEGFDKDEIVNAAEIYLSEERTEEIMEFSINHENVYLISFRDKVDVVTENLNFINKDTSSYQRKFSEPIATYDTREEALEYLKKNARKRHH